MSTELLVAVVGALSLTLGYVIKAIAERRSLNVTAAANRTNAEAEATSATAVVIAAARELVDPLRKELALERQEHAAVVERERAKLAEVRSELQAALEETKRLRVDLASMRREMEEMEQKYRQRIADLELKLT